MKNPFLPEDYTTPKGQSNYMKFEQGENRFRILSSPIMGWEEWQDKKPIRYTVNDKPSKPIDDKHPPRFFWAMIVFNHAANDIQILQITQKGIMYALEGLSKDADWGNPIGYDIKVVRAGEGMETEYTVNPTPHRPISEEVKKAFILKPIYLPALYQGADPFIDHGQVTPMIA